MLTDADVVKLLFGFKLKHLRTEQGLGLEELAAQTGLSKSYIHDLEKGKKYPKVDKIHTLARALKVDYDYMVSQRASRAIQPVVDLLTSDVFREFPLDDFGVSTNKLIELLVNTPERVTAFISTISQMIRHFQVSREHLYFTALRSFQNLKNNYFEDLEQAARAFREQYQLPAPLSLGVGELEELLREQYQVTVNRKTLHTLDLPRTCRSYFAPSARILYIREELSAAQERFLLGRELAFQYQTWAERPYETRIVEVPNFEILFNNFRASYFSSALLMDETALLKDLESWAESTHWNPDFMLQLLTKYEVTPEMLLQRLSNLLPQHFGLSDLFFIRLESSSDLQDYLMTKELHLDRLHSPYANALNEHYCRRWVSVSIIKQARQRRQKEVLVQAQLSSYWNTDQAYFCLSMARPEAQSNGKFSSVTLGLLVNEQLREKFRFLSDPALPQREVHTTCERCGITDCEARARPPLILEEKSGDEELMEKLRQLNAG